MAACSFYVSYPSQFSNDQVMMDGQNYMLDDGDIRDELVFHHPSQSADSSSSRNSISSDKRSSLLQDYFKSANALSRSIIMEKCSVEQQHSKQWTVMSDSKRDEIVDKYFVPSDVREQYDAGLIGARRSGSRLSLDNHMYSSQDDFSERYHGGMEHTDGLVQLPMSQPSDYNSHIQKAASMGGRYTSRNQRSHSAAQLLDSETMSTTNTPTAPTTSSTKSKLRNFSIRKSKNSKKQQQQKPPTVEEQKVIPSLFTRDVYELDNEVDLPDDSLLTDHIAVVEDDSFARLKPLRYSFGRKMRNKITHSGGPDLQQLQSSGSEINVNDGYMIPSNESDFFDTSLPDLTQATQFYTSNSTPDLLDEPSNRAESISPINISDDAMSITSSRPNTRTPDSSQPNRVSPNRVKPFKESTHPLSRSVRAGSSYMTVTSSFADNRRQMFKKKKNNTNSQTSDTTPINSPANSPPPMVTVTQPSQLTTQNKTNGAATLPMVKTESVNESVITDTTTSSSDLPSPMCSPPSSPAGLCPNNIGRNKRESGYISSTYPEEMSDDEEGSSKNTSFVKRKPKRTGRKMQVQRTDSFTNNH